MRQVLVALAVVAMVAGTAHANLLSDNFDDELLDMTLWQVNTPQGSASNIHVRVADDFNDNSLDAANWSVNPTLPPWNGTVVEQNQRAEIDSRAHLNTLNQYDPAATPLRITGTWSLPSGDFMQILTRCSGLPGGAYGETTSGLEFFYRRDYPVAGPGDIYIRGRGVSLANHTTHNQLNIGSYEPYEFTIVDDGLNVSLFVRDLADPTSYAWAKGQATTDMSTDYVTFHNRESSGTRISYLDDVMVARAPVLERNDRAELYARGHLVTRDQFDPLAVGGNGLIITGEWTFGSDDFLQILTRSNGLPGGTYGETQNGIEFYAYNRFDSQGKNYFQIRGRGVGVSTLATINNLDLGDGDVVNFRIVDTGANLHFWLQEINDPSSWGHIHAYATTDMANDYIVFHNREGSRTAYLDNVEIAIYPEPGSIALLGGGILALLRRRRRA